MKLTLSEPRYLKDSISIISELVTETRLKISNTGITIISMDPANVAMVVYKLLSSCFSDFEIDGDLEIGINLNNLKQILKRVENSDILTLETDENNSKLNITVNGKTTKRFAIPIIDSEDREQKEPSLEFPVTVNMPASMLASAIEDADVVADSVSLVSEADKFTVAADGDLNKVEVDIVSDDEVKIANTAESLLKAKYSLEYLKKMIAGSKIASDVQIQFNKDYPVKLSFNSVDKVSLSFVLAPRVEND